MAHFKFKNTGDKPVKILAVHPSCGCTTAQLAHDTIAPNETGEIVATFTIGQRTGVQKKVITVTTDDSPDQPDDAELDGPIFTQLLQLAPAFVYWSGQGCAQPAEDYGQRRADYRSRS